MTDNDKVMASGRSVARSSWLRGKVVPITIAAASAGFAGNTFAHSNLSTNTTELNALNSLCTTAGYTGTLVNSTYAGSCTNCHVGFDTSVGALSSVGKAVNDYENKVSPYPATDLAALCTGTPTTSTTSTTTTSTTTTTKPTSTTTTSTTTTTKPTSTTTTSTTTTTKAPTTSTTSTTKPSTTTTTKAPTTTTLPPTSCGKRNPAPHLKVAPNGEVYALINQALTITASAYDDGSVTSLTAKTGNQLIPLTAVAPAAPYTIAATFSWTPTKESERKITFTAKDNCGKTTSETVEIKVKESDEHEEEDSESSTSNTAPTIAVAQTVTAPAGQTTVLPVKAVDADGDKVSLSAKLPSGVKLTKKSSDPKTGVTTAELSITPESSQIGETLEIGLKAKDDADDAKQTAKTVKVKVTK